jgi:hypothetical protein
MAGSVEGEGGVNAWLAPVMQERQSSGERTHKNLVEAFRRAIQQQEQVLRGALTPERIVRGQLDREGRSSNKEKAEFFFHLLCAWDALAFDRYEVDAGLTGSAGYSLYSYFHEERRHGRDPTIKLSDPLQVKILDALTEAVDIPHQKGQAAIEIPEKLRDYPTYVMSEEYQQRWEQARAKRGK